MIQKIKWHLKKLIKRVLGVKEAQKPSKRKDLTIFKVDANFEFYVYWKVLRIGKGPCVLLKVLGQEFMKFDCFGQNDGHYHVSPHSSFRIFFVENSRKEQIDRAIKELRQNTHTYLQKHPDNRFRQLTMDTEAFENQLLKVEKLLCKFVETIEELR